MEWQNARAGTASTSTFYTTSLTGTPVTNYAASSLT